MPKSQNTIHESLKTALSNRFNPKVKSMDCVVCGKPVRFHLYDVLPADGFPAVHGNQCSTGADWDYAIHYDCIPGSAFHGNGEKDK
jgi:hypothetical protein